MYFQAKNTLNCNWYYTPKYCFNVIWLRNLFKKIQESMHRTKSIDIIAHHVAL
jgi:hypothetical protein